MFVFFFLFEHTLYFTFVLGNAFVMNVIIARTQLLSNSHSGSFVRAAMLIIKIRYTIAFRFNVFNRKRRNNMVIISKIIRSACTRVKRARARVRIIIIYSFGSRFVGEKYSGVTWILRPDTRQWMHCRTKIPNRILLSKDRSYDISCTYCLKFLSRALGCSLSGR